MPVRPDIDSWDKYVSNILVEFNLDEYEETEEVVMSYNGSKSKDEVIEELKSKGLIHLHEFVEDIRVVKIENIWH